MANAKAIAAEVLQGLHEDCRMEDIHFALYARHVGGDNFGAGRAPLDQTTQDVLIEFLKHKQADASTLVNTYIRAFAIFLAVMGFMFKAAVDAGVGSQLARTLAALGLGACVLGMATAGMGEMLRRDTRAALRDILARLRVDYPADRLASLAYTEVIAVVFNTLVAGAWVYFLVK